MTNKFISFKSFASDNASGMTRECIGNASALPRKLFALLFVVLWGFSQMWGVDYELVTSTNDLSAGDIVVIASSGSEVTCTSTAGSSNSAKWLTNVTSTFNSNKSKITSLGSGTAEFTLSKSSTNWIFTNGTNTLRATAEKKVILGTSGGTNTWTISIANDGTATITCTTTSYGTMKYNSSSPRFTTYSNGQQVVQLYKKPSCSTDPTVGNIMNDVSNITSSGATFGTSSGVSAGSNCSLSEVGFVYSTSQNPTITSGTKVTIANYSSGNLSKAVTGLNDNTTYYVRAFATNGHGTSYSDQKSFKTLELAKYTVQFSTGEGNPTRSDLTEASAGAGVTLPTAVVPHCSGDGWTFAGWKEASSVSSETTTAPTLLAAGSTYHPASNCTLFAVYKKEDGDPTTESSVYSCVTASNASSPIVASTSDGKFQLTLTKGQSQNNWYSTSANEWRIYQYHTVLIEAIDGTTEIDHVSIAEQSNFGAFTVNHGTPTCATSAQTSPSTIADVSSTTLTITASAQFRATSFTIYYEAPAYVYLSEPSCCTELGSINGSFS